MSNPATFDRPIIRETVEGAWADIVIRGDSALDPACIASARRLVERGAVAVTSNCGFFIRHQAAVAASVNVPVALSSLLLVPTLLRQLPRAAKLGVVTADSTKCGEDLLGADDPADRARVVVGGIEGGKLLRNALMRPPVVTDVADIEMEVANCVAELRAAHPEVAALLFECTALPYVTLSIRRSTGLPVYDITDLCRLTLESVSR
ncbi:hypothetical protein X757_31810 [Mesorhizobium sp. LSHC414A00]|nr:hypothetical protein X757_31810 [Mesorhizobium sp. LSHC414A00]